MHSTLAEKAYLHLRGMLSRGELRPGDRLVNRSLAQEIGISFTPVREAINQLASEGLVEYVRGAGAYVRRVDRRELDQLFDLRANLEPFAAEQAAQHVSSDELGEAYQLCERFRAAARELRDAPGRTASPAQWQAWLALEEAFHGLVFRASRNPWLCKVAGEIRLMALLFGPQRSGEGILTFSTACWTWREHLALVRLLEAGDAAGSRAWMAHHIDSARLHVRAWHDRTTAGEA